MKLRMTRGCIHYSMSINGTEVSSLDDNKKELSRIVLCDWIQKNEDKIPLEELMEFILESCGDYEADEHPCECCGDITEYYKLEIHEDCN